MSHSSLVIEKAHAWLPEEKANPTAEPITHVCFDTDDLFTRSKLQSLPVARHCIARKFAYQLIVLIDEHHCLQVVHVSSHANEYLFDHLALLERVAILEGHLGAELGRGSPIVEVET